jgi:hypothetical protein
MRRFQVSGKAASSLIRQWRRRDEWAAGGGGYLKRPAWFVVDALSDQARRASSFKSTPSGNHGNAGGAGRILAPVSPALRGRGNVPSSRRLDRTQTPVPSK